MDIVIKGSESVTVFDKNLAKKTIEPGPPQTVDVFYVWKKVSKVVATFMVSTQGTRIQQRQFTSGCKNVSD